MGEFIRLKTSDGVEIGGYKAAPTRAPKAGVVVIQEVFGLNRFIRAIVDDYAAAGYLAVAPATFDRIEPGYVTDDYGQATFAKVGELMKSFKPELALLDVAAASKEVAGAGKIGVTGFCLGGNLSWRAAHQGMGFAAASGYYGGGVPSYIDLAPKIPLEMHYGEEDHGIPIDQVDELRGRYPDVPIFLYPGVHGFANFDRPGNYNEASAKLAWERTLAFFAEHLK